MVVLSQFFVISAWCWICNSDLYLIWLFVVKYGAKCPISSYKTSVSAWAMDATLWKVKKEKKIHVWLLGENTPSSHFTRSGIIAFNLNYHRPSKNTPQRTTFEFSRWRYKLWKSFIHSFKCILIEIKIKINFASLSSVGLK